MQMERKSVSLSYRLSLTGCRSRGSGALPSDDATLGVFVDLD
jgi:hypothetical protein